MNPGELCPARSHHTGRTRLANNERKDVARMNKMDELLHVSKLNDLLKQKEENNKKKNTVIWILAIMGAVAAVAAIAYAVYRFLTPDYLEDFEDDFEDDFDDDFFEDEEDAEEEKKEEKAEETETAEADKKEEE